MSNDSFNEFNAFMEAVQVFVNKRLEDGQDLMSEAEVDEALQAILQEAPLYRQIAELRKQEYIECEPTDVDKLRDEIYRRLAIVPGGSGVLDLDQEEWLDEEGQPIRQPDFQGYKFYERYREWLLTSVPSHEKEAWPEAVVKTLDEDSMKVLRRLNDPTLPGEWRRRGMVVGHVQSGKTANFTAVANRALDTGFDLVIVLTGIMEDLRCQTQERLDLELLGSDTSTYGTGKHGRIGVGAPPIKKRKVPFFVDSLTQNIPKVGDFGKHTATQQGQKLNMSETKFLIVSKKNVHILGHIHKWAKSHLTGDQKRINKSLLLIDDECDQASVNTGKSAKDTDLTSINKGIRKILQLFKRTAYVGYTATPFANIFIEPTEGKDQNYEAMFADDLFPRDFIVMLDPSNEYVGPRRFFGLRQTAGIEGEKGYPVVLDNSDAFGVFPRGHKKDLAVQSLPTSLEDALLYYLIAAGTMLRRNLRSNITMLVHVTRFVNVHFEVKQQVEAFLEQVNAEIQYVPPHDPKAVYWPRLQTLLDDEIRNKPWVHQIAAGYKVALPDDLAEIVEEIREFARDVKPLAVNGDKRSDQLEYQRDEDNWYIAIGGDRLSRGLTLKGLTVSYFSREARLYDALMQMGRWFGYRNKYLDLCRLWTTNTVYENYRTVALAIEELRRDFHIMEAEGKTPQDFGLKVRMSPVSGFIITSRNKLREAKEYNISLGGQNLQILAYDQDEAVHRHNHKQVRDLIKSLDAIKGVTKTSGTPRTTHRIDNCVVYQGVPAKEVMRFLHTQKVSSGNQLHTTPPLIIDYIQTKNVEGELLTWTVVVPTSGSGDPVPDFPDWKMLKRRSVPNHETTPSLNRVKVITSPGFESIDLDDAQYDAALDATRKHPDKSEKAGDIKTPSPYEIRRHRSRAEGLLQLYPIDPKHSPCGTPNKEDEEVPEGWEGLKTMDVPVWGYAVSLPGTRNPATGVKYMGNSTYAKQLLEATKKALQDEMEESGDEDEED